MNEFSKPLLTEETPEPPLVEQRPQSHENERLKQALASIKGATSRIEEAGLAPKPVSTKTIPKPAAKAVAAKADPVSSPPMRQKAAMKVEKEPHKVAAKKKPLPVNEKAQEPQEQAPQHEPDMELLLRQKAIAEAVGSMAGNPDTDVFHLLLKLFADAPEKEILAAAIIISTAYLRTPAKQRQPLLKALQPALRAFRTTKLAALISAKLGAALVNKPPAPPAPPGG